MKTISEDEEKRLRKRMRKRMRKRKEGGVEIVEAFESQLKLG